MQLSLLQLLYLAFFLSLRLFFDSLGREPLRAEPNGFRVHLLNRSDTGSLEYYVVVAISIEMCRLEFGLPTTTGHIVFGQELLRVAMLVTWASHHGFIVKAGFTRVAFGLSEARFQADAF